LEDDFEQLIFEIKHICKEDAVVFFRVQYTDNFDPKSYNKVISKYFNGTIYEYYKGKVLQASYFTNIVD
jgi:hypothetical protein